MKGTTHQRTRAPRNRGTAWDLGSRKRDTARTWKPKRSLPATGLQVAGYRFYSPELGRWASRDPAFEAGGENLYSYAENSPTLKTDPLGMLPWCGRCNGQAFDKLTHCCCRGHVTSRVSIPSGVRICHRWVGAFKGPIPGFVPHTWVEWPGGSAGYSQNSGTPYVSSPEDAGMYVDNPGKSCHDVLVMPCEVDISNLWDSLRSLAGYYQRHPPPGYILGFRDCRWFALKLVDEAKYADRSRGCTVTGG